jgi:hypothetical protein
LIRSSSSLILALVREIANNMPSEAGHRRKFSPFLGRRLEVPFYDESHLFILEIYLRV